MTSTSTAEAGRVADTSFLYALFSLNDQFHADAIRAASGPNRILIPSEIFAETMALIQYRQGFAAAERAGNWMRAQGRVQFLASDDRRMDAAWRVFRRARGHLSYPDSAVVAWCKKLRARALAYDEQIREAL